MDKIRCRTLTEILTNTPPPPFSPDYVSHMYVEHNYSNLEHKGNSDDGSL